MILFRYISGEFTRTVLVCATGFVGLALTVDLFEKAGLFLKYNATFAQIFRYGAYRSPEFITWTIPIAAMMGTLLTLVSLSKRNEVTAILAGGISRRRIALPILVISLFLSGFHFLLSEKLVPRANQLARDVLQVEIKKRSPRKLYDRTGRWFYAEGAFIRVGGWDENSLKDLLILRPKTDHTNSERIDAPDAHWNGRHWVLGKGRKVQFGKDNIQIETSPPGVRLPLTLKPQDLDTQLRHTDEWSFQELRRIISHRKKLGQDVRRESVELYGKIALPFAALIMSLVSLPFGFRKPRSGSPALGIVTGLGLGFAYWVIMAIGLAIGSGGTLTPFVAAWMPNLLFGSVGVYLALTLDQL